MEKPWKTMEKPWKNHGKTMEKNPEKTMEKPWKTRYCLEKPWKTLYSIHPGHVSWQILLYPDMFLGFFRVVLGFVKSTLPENLHWFPCEFSHLLGQGHGTHKLPEPVGLMRWFFFWPRERCFHTFPPKKEGIVWMPKVDIWPKEATEINRVCGKNMNQHMLDNQDPPKIEHETIWCNWGA